MTPFEIIITVFIALMSLVVLVVGGMLIVILWQLKKGLDRINHLLYEATFLKKGLERAAKAAMSTASGLVKQGVKSSVRRAVKAATKRG